MITLGTMVTAYLINNDDFLLMKRAINRTFAPGIWAGVGGHMEPSEINNPQQACLREIYEETAINKEQIHDMILKYIIYRRCKDEIRIQYVFIAETKTRDFVNTEEGELFWISRDKLFDREFSATSSMTLLHYVEKGDRINDVLIGTVSSEDGKPIINWSPLQDWEL